MKLDNLKRTLALSAFGLAGLFVMTDTANAQNNRQERREDRQERREDRREDRQERREDLRDARSDGYREGLEEGRKDARARRRYSPQTKADYRRGGDEQTRREQQAFRTRFMQGYREGYYNNNRSGGNRNDIYGQQSAIQTRNVRINGRTYRETYRVTYNRNGAAQTQLISRVRIN